MKCGVKPGKIVDKTLPTVLPYPYPLMKLYIKFKAQSIEIEKKIVCDYFIRLLFSYIENYLFYKVRDLSKKRLSCLSEEEGKAMHFSSYN